MRQHRGSPDRQGDEDQIQEQIEPEPKKDEEMDEEMIGSGDLYEGVLVREELEKVVKTYFKYLSDQGISSDKENKDEVVEECQVLFRDILKVQKINKISITGLWRMLGQICRKETEEIDRGIKFTDDKTLGKSIYEDIIKRANGHHEFGVS